MPDVHALYVQVNQILDDPDETLEDFGLRLRKALADDAIQNVILDLRNNNGGNTFDYIELLRTLIGFSQRDGRGLYVIIGRTYIRLPRISLPILKGSRHPCSSVSRRV